MLGALRPYIGRWHADHHAPILQEVAELDLFSCYFKLDSGVQKVSMNGLAGSQYQVHLPGANTWVLVFSCSILSDPTLDRYWPTCQRRH